MPPSTTLGLNTVKIPASPRTVGIPNRINELFQQRRLLDVPVRSNPNVTTVDATKAGKVCTHNGKINFDPSLIEPIAIPLLADDIVAVNLDKVSGVKYDDDISFVGELGCFTTRSKIHEDSILAIERKAHELDPTKIGLDFGRGNLDSITTAFTVEEECVYLLLMTNRQYRRAYVNQQRSYSY